MDAMRDLPLGLGMALAQNTQALNAFAAMPQDQQQRVIQHTHTIRSKQEMQAYVNSLV